MPLKSIHGKFSADCWSSSVSDTFSLPSFVGIKNTQRLMPPQTPITVQVPREKPKHRLGSQFERANIVVEKQF